jgi:hypothetical protein
VPQVLRSRVTGLKIEVSLVLLNLCQEFNFCVKKLNKGNYGKVRIDARGTKIISGTHIGCTLRVSHKS